MQTLVDSNVVIDVATRSPEWFDWSVSCLAEAIEGGDVIVNQVVFAEVGAAYPDHMAVDAMFGQIGIQLAGLTWLGAHLAGRRFREYRRAGGRRERTLPDFLIGAHAEVAGMRLLTRDVRVYRRWFPSVELISP